MEAVRGKGILSKFCDSVLNKSGKLRSLIADLQKNYIDESASKSDS